MTLVMIYSGTLVYKTWVNHLSAAMEKSGAELRLLNLFESKAAREVTLDKREFLVRSDKPSKGLYLVKSGIVKQVMQRRGSTFTIGYDGAGSIHGTELIFEVSTPFSAMVLTPVEALFLPAESLKQITNTDLRTVDFMAWACEEKLKKLANKLIDLHSMDASQHIAMALLEISRLNGYDHTGSIARKELSNYAGCSVEYAFRTLANWQKTGVITIDGKNIIIKNRKALNNIVE